MLQYQYRLGFKETSNLLTLSQTNPGFMCVQYKSFESTVGKEENACNKQFLLFTYCFYHF